MGRMQSSLRFNTFLSPKYIYWDLPSFYMQEISSILQYAYIQKVNFNLTVSIHSKCNPHPFTHSLLHQLTLTPNSGRFIKNENTSI